MKKTPISVTSSSSALNRTAKNSTITTNKGDSELKIGGSKYDPTNTPTGLLLEKELVIVSRESNDDMGWL